MKLSTKGRYAVTAMLDLALHATDNPVNLAEISERQNISVSYLEQLFAKLRKHGLVDSVRGPGGGYRLKNGPETVRVSDIIIAVDEGLDVTRCKGKADCHGGSRCLTHELWRRLSCRIYEFLEGITLGELIAEQSVQETAQRQVRALSGYDSLIGAAEQVVFVKQQV